MPSLGRCSPQQADEYQDTVLPPEVPTLAVEAGVHLRLGPLGRRHRRHRPLRCVRAGRRPARPQFGFTPEHVADRARALARTTSPHPTEPRSPGAHHDPTPATLRRPAARARGSTTSTRAGSPAVSSQRWVERGIRGITSNPSIFQKAIEGAEAYDEQFALAHRARGSAVEDAYWELVTTDITEALAVLRPGPRRQPTGSTGSCRSRSRPRSPATPRARSRAARELHRQIDEPNLYVKIPGTAEGVPAIEADDRRGPQHQRDPALRRRPLRRGDRGLPLRARDVRGGWRRPVDRGERGVVLREPGRHRGRPAPRGHRHDAAAALRGKAAVANAKVAYELFQERFAGPRWEALAAAGAQVQRPLWASTSTKNPAYPDTLYVDTLIGPDTVNTMPDATLDAFEDHGTLARTVDVGLDEAHADAGGARRRRRRPRRRRAGPRGRRAWRRSPRASTSCSPASPTKAARAAQRGLSSGDPPWRAAASSTTCPRPSRPSSSIAFHHRAGDVFSFALSGGRDRPKVLRARCRRRRHGDRLVEGRLLLG